MDESTELVTQAKEVVAIQNTNDYYHVVAMRGLLSDASKAYQNEHNPGIEGLKFALDNARQRLNDRIAPLEAERSRLGVLMSAWNAEQERLKRQLQAEADLEAKRKQQEDAKLAESMGQKGLAKKILATPPAPVFVPEQTPKIDGVSYAETWHYEVTDLMALVKAVAACKKGGPPIQAIADPGKPFRSGYIHQQVTSLKDSLQWPGVRVWSKKEPRQS